MKVIGLVIILVGLGLLGVSLTFERYTDENEFIEKYMSLDGQENRTEQYYELRENYLTPKIKLENYGVTITIIGIIFFSLSTIGFKNLRTPRKKVWIVLIGILAALLTSIFYVGDLFLEMYRDSYPPWADSLAIPLMGVPVILIVLMLWAGINSMGVIGEYKLSVRILAMKSNHLHHWYAFILMLTVIITCWTIITGDFWQVIPAFLWTYFYISILAGRREAKIEKEKQLPKFSSS